METDLSLIEIGAEDDSLIHQIPSSNTNLFSCSPLQILRFKRPSTDIIEVGKDEGKCSFPSQRESSNKENINISMKTSEALKCSAEPQQMKRRKKGGGQNLRKSLAWDRAFFTDEGVLDPIELSMISGSFSSSSEETTSVIGKEGRHSSSVVSKSTDDTTELLAVEYSLLQKLPGNLVEDGKIGCPMSAKHASSAQNNVAPVPVGPEKALPAHNGKKSVFKRSSCPRPLGSSSQKKLMNTSTVKAAMNDLKHAKPPNLNPDPCSVRSTTTVIKPGALRSKCNQTAQPATNVQKSVGLKGLPKNIKNIRNNARSGPDGIPLPTKTSAHHSLMDVHNSKSTSSQSSPVNGASIGSEATPDQGQPAKASRGHDGSDKESVSLLQNANRKGQNMPTAPSSSAKPTGLRMPSPSLGYFNQSKSSASQSIYQGNTQRCNLLESKIPTFHKQSISSHIPELQTPSVVDPISQLNMKSDGKIGKLQKAEMKISTDSSNPEKINKQQMVNLLDDIQRQSWEYADVMADEPAETVIVSHGEVIESHMKDSNMILNRISCEQSGEDYDSRKDDVCWRELDTIHFPCQSSPSVQFKDVSTMSGLAEKSNLGDRQVQSIRGNVFAEGVSSNWSASVIEHQDATVKNANELPLGEQITKVNERLCENDNISLGKLTSDVIKIADECVVDASVDKVAKCPCVEDRLFPSSETEPAVESGLSVRNTQPLSSKNNLWDANVNISERNISLEEDQIKSTSSPNCKLQGNLKSDVLVEKVKAVGMPLKETVDDKKQVSVATKPKLSAAPFSDEWLAAIEAAGEEILTMKSGAVQNSPTEKSLPEPGPWSPVKRKTNQEIGPYDCTKFTNNPHLQ